MKKKNKINPQIKHNHKSSDSPQTSQICTSYGCCENLHNGHT